MKITYREFLIALTNAQRDKRFKNLKFERWLWESFAFDNSGAHYIRPEYRKVDLAQHATAAELKR